MSARTLAQLRIALLALIPKTGTPVTTADLARHAAASEEEVAEALFDPWNTGDLVFDMAADAYSHPGPAAS